MSRGQRYSLLTIVGHFFFLVGYGQRADTSMWIADRLNTGKTASYLEELEKNVLFELNKMRVNPPAYAQLYIEPMMAYFKGKVDTKHNIQTSEGVSAVQECIAQMRMTPKMGVLEPHKGLSAAASRHTALQSKTDEIGHTSPNGETFEYRLRKVKFMSTAECISYGEDVARDIVISLLIDDGVSNRGHRRTLLNPGYTFVGISAGNNKAYAHMCTLDFGGGPIGGK